MQHLKERRTPTSRVDLGIVDAIWLLQVLTNTLQSTCERVAKMSQFADEEGTLLTTLDALDSHSFVPNLLP